MKVLWSLLIPQGSCQFDAGDPGGELGLSGGFLNLGEAPLVDGGWEPGTAGCSACLFLGIETFGIPGMDAVRFKGLTDGVDLVRAIWELEVGIGFELESQLK